MVDWFIIAALGGSVIYWCFKDNNGKHCSGCTDCPLACSHRQPNQPQNGVK